MHTAIRHKPHTGQHAIALKHAAAKYTHSQLRADKLAGQAHQTINQTAAETEPHRSCTRAAAQLGAPEEKAQQLHSSLCSHNTTCRAHEAGSGEVTASNSSQWRQAGSRNTRPACCCCCCQPSTCTATQQAGKQADCTAPVPVLAHGTTVDGGTAPGQASKQALCSNRGARIANHQHSTTKSSTSCRGQSCSCYRLRNDMASSKTGDSSPRQRLQPTLLLQEAE